MSHEQSYGKRIRAIRRSKDITQKELAEATGLDQSYISKIERGDVAGTPENLLKIAKALGVTVSDIMGDAETTKFSEEALEFLRAFEELPPEHRAALQAAAQALVDSVKKQTGEKVGKKA